MRQIKFRAWDKLRGQMVHDGWAVRFKPEKTNSGIMLEPDETPNTERIYGEWNDSDSIVLMQFTGLHDKNGKEIFEGDLVAYRGEFTPEDEQKPQEVWYDEDWATWMLGSGFRLIDFKHDAGGKHYEVLGNIYENPELIR